MKDLIEKINMSQFQLHSSDIKHLRSEELDHEIKVRGEQPLNTVDNKRKQLSILIHKERRGSIKLVLDKTQITKEEALNIEETISRLGEAVDFLTPETYKKEGLRIETRLGHYLTRVQLWPETEEDIVRIKLRTIQILNQFLLKLDTKTIELDETAEGTSTDEEDSQDEEDVQDPPILHDNSKQPHTLENVHELPENTHNTSNERQQIISLMEDNYSEQIRQEVNSKFNSMRNANTVANETTINSPQQNYTSINPSKGQDRRIPKIYKWKIKFTGDDDSMSVDRFLELVDIKRCAENFSWDDIFTSASDLFDKTALTWYMAHRHRFRNWRDLQVKLCSSFSHHMAYVLLWKEIINSKQQENESVIAYVSKLRILFRRLPKPVEESLQTEIVLINALPKYQERLHFIDIHNLDDLEMSMLRLESPTQPVPAKNEFDKNHNRNNRNHRYNQLQGPKYYHNNYQNNNGYHSQLQRPKQYHNNNWNNYQTPQPQFNAAIANDSYQYNDQYWKNNNNHQNPQPQYNAAIEYQNHQSNRKYWKTNPQYQHQLPHNNQYSVNNNNHVPQQYQQYNSPNEVHNQTHMLPHNQQFNQRRYNPRKKTKVQPPQQGNELSQYRKTDQ